MFFAFRVLGAELFAVEFGKSIAPEEEKKLEGAPAGQFEYGFTYSESDVIVAKDGTPCP